MAYTTTTLSDTKAAVVVSISGTDRYFRVRKVSQSSPSNESGGQAFVDTAIKVQSYEVDADGAELAADDIVGETRFGAASIDGDTVNQMIARLTNRAIDHHVSKIQSALLQEQIPDELVG